MDQQTIRESIRSKLASGHLKLDDGKSVRAGIGGRQPCRACGHQIDPGYATPYGHAYPDGTHWFHVACHALWEDERRLRLPTLELSAGVGPLLVVGDGS